MYNFEYVRPGSVEDAVQKLKADPEAKALGGGQTYIPTLKQRLAMPSKLIDLKALKDLNYVKAQGSGLAIGATTRHKDVATSEVAKKVIPSLAHLASLIGDPAVRAMGTMGGSVANSDPAADYPAAVLALKGTVVTDRREIAGDDFFTGLFETALEPDEIVTEVRFEAPEAGRYAKFRNPASRYAIVGVFVAKFADGVRVGVSGAADHAFRATELERALSSNFTPDAAMGVKMASGSLNADIHASSEYRAHLISVMAKRAVAEINAG